MRVRGISVALVAITAALIVTSVSSSPMIDPQVVHKNMTKTASIAPQHEENWLLRDAKRASRSRPALPKQIIEPKIVHVSVSRETSWVWAHTYNAYSVANCESGDHHGSNDHYNGNPHLHGYYSGKWQMNANFWSSYGGLQFASNAADASEDQQDAVAFKGFQERGWQPWECSRIMRVS